MRCRDNNTDENGDLMETTTTSAMSILEEEMDVSDVFDVTRPERQLPTEDMENSIHDVTITDITPTAPVTYAIIDSGTERGKPKLGSSDGYSFVFKRQLKSGDVVWRCSVRGKSTACTASVKQSGDVFTPMAIDHIHTSKSGLASAILQKKEVKKKAADDVFETTTNIIRHVNQLLPPTDDQPEAARCSQAALSMLCMKIDKEYLQRTLGETFYRETISVKERRHILFATDDQLTLLSRAKTWYLDGTLKVVRAPFYQMLSVLAFIRAGDCMKQVPLCFVLMSGKRRSDYKKVFTAILQHLPSTKVKSFVVDYEAGLWQAIRAVFPHQPEIHGCAFHFEQALYRKVQELGLQTAYNARGEVHELLRKTFALPLLPVDDIRPAFESLRAKSETDLTNQYFDYIERTWIDNELWPIESWCVFGRSIRTNNDCEGWHHRLNRRAKKANLPLYVLIQLLFEEGKMLNTQVRLVKERKLRRHQTKQTLQVQGKLWVVWNRYNDKLISTSQFLSLCASMYGPV